MVGVRCCVKVRIEFDGLRQNHLLRRLRIDTKQVGGIEGFTDSVASANANLDLSGRRANAVMAALIALGVPANRLSALAFGEKMPAAINDTPTGRQLNRRVEIVFAPPLEIVPLK